MLHVERSEPLVAIGGGALGDTAGLLAALYLRGVRFIQVPTTLVAQIDSAIGGKTGVDLPEGKNLVGAFHQPVAIVIDVALLRTLPGRQLRAALAEAVKMAALGDERLFELLEAHGPAIATGDDAAFETGAVAELVERAGVGEGRGGDRGRARAGRVGRPDRPEPRALAGARGRGRGGLWRPAPRGSRRVRPPCRGPARRGRRRDARRPGRPDHRTAGPPGARHRTPALPARRGARRTSRPTRSTWTAASAGSCRPRTASWFATTSSRRRSSARRSSLLAVGSAR